MNKRSSIIVGVAIVFASITQTSEAKTLLGENYIGGSFGVVQFGDDELDDILGNGYALEGAGNINLTPNIDLNLGVAYLWADGEMSGIEVDVSALSGSASLVYHFLPNEKINPFVSGGVGVVRSEVEASAGGFSEDESETDTSFSAGGGVEIEATEEVLFRVGADYINVDSEDDVALSATLGYWFSDQLLGGLGITYSVDSEDIIANIGLVFTM